MPYRRGTKWVAQVRKKEVRIEKIFQTKKEATEWESTQRQIPEENWRKETNTVCLHDWASQYLDFAKNKYTHNTYKEKQSVFKRMFTFVDPTMNVVSLTKKQVLDYLQVQNETRSGYAANKDRKNLLAAWNWGIKYLGMPSLNPYLVDRFPEERQRRYIPPEKDFWEVFGLTEGQDRLMLLAYLHLAARKKELFRLRWDDLDFGQSRIQLGTRKRVGGSMEYDWLPMTDELFGDLLKHRQSSQSDWVFPNPNTGMPYTSRQRWMRQSCKRAGVRAFGLHAIRHLTASILAQANVPMIEIQGILRHKNLATTERYIRRLSDLRQALRVLVNKKSRLIEPSTLARREAKFEVVQ